MARPRFRFPGPRDRVSINGMTGSGKSTAALWSFAESADFDKKPWILVDYKGEDIILEMERNGDAKPIKSVRDDPPRQPGIYVVHPSPHETGDMADFLWKIWRRGHTGLFFDEVYMVPEFKGDAGSGGPLKSILTQGRSKEIPVYALAQRPVDVNRHVYTEANFYWLFRLRSKDDYQRVLSYLPDDLPAFETARQFLSDPKHKHWSIYYDAGENVALTLRPVPSANRILDIVAERIENIKRKQSL